MPSSGSSSTTDAAVGPAPDDSRPTIVFLHGTVLTGAAWAAQIAALSDAYHCLAPDLPGHGTAAGDAVHRRRRGRADRRADRARGAWRAGDPRRAVARRLRRDGRGRALARAGRPGSSISGATAEPVGLRALGFRAFSAVLGARPGAGPRRGLPRGSSASGFRRPSPSRSSQRASRSLGGAVAIDALVGSRFSPRLGGVPRPEPPGQRRVRPVLPADGAGVRRGCPDPRRVLIRRATHLANLDQPERFTAAIRRFAESPALGPGVADPD